MPRYELYPDILLWLGVKKIDKFVTTSDAKISVLRAAGIQIVETIGLPEGLVPVGAKTESLARKESSDELVGNSPKRQRVSSKRKSGEGGGSKIPEPKSNRVVLTTHPSQYSVDPLPIKWGAADPNARGAVVATLLSPQARRLHSRSLARMRARARASCTPSR